MFLNSLSTVGIATQVWAQATRTLTADPATAAGAATLVWAQANRFLSSFGAGCLTISVQTNQSTAASATSSFPGAGGQFIQIDVGMKAGAAGTYVSGFNDGTNTYNSVSVAAAGTGCDRRLVGSGVSVTLKNNDGANAATFCVNKFVWNL